MTEQEQAERIARFRTIVLEQIENEHAAEIDRVPYHERAELNRDHARLMSDVIMLEQVVIREAVERELIAAWPLPCDGCGTYPSFYFERAPIPTNAVDCLLTACCPNCADGLVRGYGPDRKACVQSWDDAQDWPTVGAPMPAGAAGNVDTFYDLGDPCTRARAWGCAGQRCTADGTTYTYGRAARA